MARSALDEAAAHWGPLGPAPLACAGGGGGGGGHTLKAVGSSVGARGGPARDGTVRGGMELRRQAARQGRSMQPDGQASGRPPTPRGRGVLGSGPQKELPGCWAGAVAPGKGKERGQRASGRKLLGLGGRAEGSMLPFLAGPGLGSERRGSDWGQRPARPASRGPLSLLYALWLRLAPPLPRCKGKASPGLPAWPYVTGQPTPADTWARPHLGTAPPGSQGAFPRGPAFGRSPGVHGPGGETSLQGQVDTCSGSRLTPHSILSVTLRTPPWHLCHPRAARTVNLLRASLRQALFWEPELSEQSERGRRIAS